MRRISQDCGLDRSTVKNILGQPEIAEALRQSRDTLLAALPAISEMATADILKERDRELGFQVLKKAGAFPQEDGRKLNALLQDNRLGHDAFETIGAREIEKRSPVALDVITIEHGIPLILRATLRWRGCVPGRRSRL